MPSRFGIPIIALTLRRTDVAFLISDHFKKQRRGPKQDENDDVVYSELGGRVRKTT